MARRVETSIRFDGPTIQGMLRAPNGMVGRDMDKRADRVLVRARELVGIHTGRLYRSLKTRRIATGDGPGVMVYSDLRYARYHHDGTGIYGARGEPIRPRTAAALRFRPRRASADVFAMEVRGSRPNPFLREALEAAADPTLRARARAVLSRLAGRNGAPAAGVRAGRDAAKIPGSGPRPPRPASTRRRRAQQPIREGWQGQVSGGRRTAGEWQRGVSGGRRRNTGGAARDTGWVRDVGPGPRPRNSDG